MAKLILLRLDRSNTKDLHVLFGKDTSRYSPWHWGSAIVSSYIPSRGNILDLASGHGNPYIMRTITQFKFPWLEIFKRFSFRVELVDMLPPPGEKLLPYVRYTQCDLRNSTPPFTKSFDCIVSISSLEHLPEVARLRQFQWIKDSLSLNGIAAITIGHWIGIKNLEKVKDTFINHPRYVNRKYGAYPPIDMKKILVSLGFEPGDLPNEASKYPGMINYNDLEWDNDETICKSFFSNYPELAKIPWMADIAVCEILIVVRRIA